MVQCRCYGVGKEEEGDVEGWGMILREIMQS